MERLLRIAPVDAARLRKPEWGAYGRQIGGSFGPAIKDGRRQKV